MEKREDQLTPIITGYLRNYNHRLYQNFFTQIKIQKMIARVWKGKTKIEDAAAYTAFMKNRAVPDYESTEGFVKLIFLKRTDKDYAFFELITFWEDLAMIQNFAGDPIEKAKYYPEDQNFLLEFPETVTHFEVFAE